MAVKGWIIGGGAALVAVGAGAATWAAVSFFDAGPQAAEALPADTIAYVSLDVNPSGSQKIAALKLVNKFPSLKKELGVSSEEDVRRKLVESITEGSGCDIDYDKDVKPWLGSTVAFGIVGKTDPQVVAALEIKDAKKATAGIHDVLACTESEEEPVAFAVNGDFLVFGKDENQAKTFVTAAKKSSLADDDDFKKWTDAAGDPGILTAYAAPDAGSALAGQLTDLGSLGSDLGGLEGGDLGSSALSWCPGASDAASGADTSSLKSFKGAGATVRFGDDGLELDVAGDFGITTIGSHSADVADLPADVSAVLGIGFSDNWLDSALESLKKTCGDQFDPQSLYDMVSEFTGLDAPADLETLTSDSLQLVLGGDLDVEEIINSADPSSLPVALRVKGDPDKISAVIAKLDALAPGSTFLETKAGKDSVSLGFDTDLRDQLAKGGKLGDDKDFQAVVPEGDKASSVIYVDFAKLKKAINDATGSDAEVEANLEPLQGLGLSAWLDGSVTHAQLVLSVK
ncbi:MAG: DUF3352 domain-containing protein [Nocardioides sp.]|uniref:DUF3352 domain-containing protein n=1 Tax=Nocardioides sp. TaxID=35761 RepID=UPI0039E4A53F